MNTKIEKQPQTEWNGAAALFGLLAQYNSRVQGGEVFLQEAARLMDDYGGRCQRSGMNIAETTRAFLLFRRSTVAMLFETSALPGPCDETTMRLFQRTNDFFDALLLSVLEGYCRSTRTASAQSPRGSDPCN